MCFEEELLTVNLIYAYTLVTLVEPRSKLYALYSYTVNRRQTASLKQLYSLLKSDKFKCIVMLCLSLR